MRIPVLPLPKDYMFPQTSFCVPFSAVYKKAYQEVFQVSAVQPVVENLQKIVGKIIENVCTPISATAI